MRTSVLLIVAMSGLLVVLVALGIWSWQKKVPLARKDGMKAPLSYEDTLRRLQQIGYLGQGESPPMPDHRPQMDDEILGFSFFRTRVAADDLSGLTLRRTYFAKSEVNGTSFADTDLSESTMCWNDFIAVNFSGARLTDCDMRASVFENCVFDNADLSDSDLRKSSFSGCTFKGAAMRGVVLGPSHRSALALSNEQLSAIDWREDDGEDPPGG